MTSKVQDGLSQVAGVFLPGEASFFACQPAPYRRDGLSAPARGSGLGGWVFACNRCEDDVRLVGQLNLLVRKPPAGFTSAGGWEMN